MLTAPQDAKMLADAMCLANSKIAREVGRLYKWKEKVWGRRYRSLVLTQEDEVHIQRLRYLISHGVKEGLVERVLDWPGVHCAEYLLSGKPMEGLWFDRTAEYRARQKGLSFGPLDFATPEQIHFSPLPCWAHLSQDEIQDRIQESIDHIEQEAAVKRARGEMPKAMGAKRLLKQRPHAKPKKLKRSPAPAFHGASQILLRQLKEAYWAFVSAYLLAGEKLRQGKTDVEFPDGSFPPALPFVRGSPKIGAG